MKNQQVVVSAVTLMISQHPNVFLGVFLVQQDKANHA